MWAKMAGYNTPTNCAEVHQAALRNHFGLYQKVQDDGRGWTCPETGEVTQMLNRLLTKTKTLMSYTFPSIEFETDQSKDACNWKRNLCSH